MTELAFYDALEANDSAVKVLGDDTLKTIAGNSSSPCARMSPSTGRSATTCGRNCACYVKRILRKYGYPPDMQEKATQTVLEQAEVLSEMWVDALSCPGYDDDGQIKTSRLRCSPVLASTFLKYATLVLKMENNSASAELCCAAWQNLALLEWHSRSILRGPDCLTS